MTTATIVENARQQGITVEDENIFSRAVCLALELHRLGTKRKVKTSRLEAQVNTDETLIHVSKDLLESPELDAIKQHDGQLRKWVADKTSGPALFKNGVYMLAYPMLKEVDTHVSEQLFIRSESLVPAFVRAYEASVRDAKVRLQALFEPLDYPSVAEVEAAFTASVRYFVLGEPTGLAAIDAEIFEREQQKTAALWADALDESRNVMRLELQELVDHLVDRLSPDASGKAKRFNPSTVQNLEEFLSEVGKRSIAKDAGLQGVIDAARDALAGTTVKDLADSKRDRRLLAERFTAVKTQLDSLVTMGRRYEFD